MAEKHGISQPVRRREGVRLVTGHGTYADDVNHAGQAYVSFVRSPVAHGIIQAVHRFPRQAHPV